jgi:prepilin-type N-terminal cleavage/methylation domain-containing protein
MRYKNKITGLSRLGPLRPRNEASNQAKTGKKQSGFTLIELLVVIAIIGLLASIALIALTSARQKGRDAKRLADMAQMNTGLELYFATNKGYPSGTAEGVPTGMSPFTGTVPSAPQPADGACGSVNYPSPVPAGYNGSNYYFYATGTSYLGADGSTQVYPDYDYYFCLGAQTGSYPPGLHVLTPEGVQ